jgi:hypothetical protein
MLNLIEDIQKTDAYTDAVQKAREKKRFWSGSPLEDMQWLPSGSKGHMFEKIVLNLCSKLYNFETKTTKSKETDAIINGFSVEIKSSTSWQGIPGMWVWQQIRRFHEYERMLFLGIDPDKAHLFWCTKRDLDYNLFPFRKNIQHGGKRGNQQLYWLRVSYLKGDFPHYLKTMDTF